MTPEREAELRRVADLFAHHGANESGERVGRFIEEVFAALDAERASHEETRRERDVLGRGLEAAVPDYPHQDPLGSGHPWPLVPIAAVLAADAKTAEWKRERDEFLRMSIASGNAEKKAERERDEAQAALVGLRDALKRYDDLVDTVGERPSIYAARRGLEAAIDATPSTLAGQVRAKVLREARDVVNAYRETKPPCPPQDMTLHVSQQGHAEYLRGVASGERSALYSAICRLDSLANDAERGGR